MNEMVSGVETVRSHLNRVLNRRTWPVLLPAQVVFAWLLVRGVGDANENSIADYFTELVALSAALMLPVGAVVAGHRSVLSDYPAKLAAVPLVTTVLMLPVIAATWIVLRLQPAGAALAERPWHGLAMIAGGTVTAAVAGWGGLVLTLVIGSRAIAVGLAWFWVLVEITLLLGSGEYSDEVKPWLVLVNAEAVIGHGTSYEVLDASNPFRGTGSDELSFGRGLRYSACLTGAGLLLGGIAGLVRRRVGTGR